MVTLQQIIDDPSAHSNADVVKWLADQLHCERYNKGSIVEIEFRAIENPVSLPVEAIRILNRIFGSSIFDTVWERNNLEPITVRCKLTHDSCNISDNLQQAIGLIISHRYKLGPQEDYYIFNIIGRLVQLDKAWLPCYDLLQNMTGKDEDTATSIEYSLFNILDIIAHFPASNIDAMLVTVMSTIPNSEMCMFYSKHYANWTSLSNELLLFNSFSHSVRTENIDEFVTLMGSKINELIGGVSNADFADQVRDKLVQFLITQNSM